MNTLRKTFGLGLAAVVLSCLGCDKVIEIKPTTTPYTFIARDAQLRAAFGRSVMGDPAEGPKITAFITEPEGWEIRFATGKSLQVARGEASKEMRFAPGLYPFQLTAPGQSDSELCGAMMVIDVDETVALATFGKAEETRLFAQEFVRKSRTGVLTDYTISFDGKPVIMYWLGDRKSPSEPGNPTVEMDFSGTAGVKEIRINDRRVSDWMAVLDVFKMGRDPQTRQPVTLPVSHKIEIELNDGRAYNGYIRNLRPNAFTTFVQLPCSIPQSLFEAADKGTIAKFSVFPEGQKETPVAEIVFGRAKGS